MNKSLNKGIPIKSFDKIEIDLDIFSQIFETPDILENYLDNEIENCEIELSKILSSDNLRILRLPFRINIVFDKKTKSNKIVFDYSPILETILYYLNIDKDKYNIDSEIIDPNLLLEINNKLTKLRNIKLERKLESKFKDIYPDYLIAKENYEQYQLLLKKYNNDKEILRKALQKLDSFIQVNFIINFISKNKNVEYYCNSFADIIDNILMNYSNIREFISNKEIKVLEDNKYDKDLFEFIIASSYIGLINKENDINKKQRLLFYLNAYIKEHKDWINKNIQFTLNNEKFTFDELYKEYLNILVNNPELKIIDIDREEFDTFTSEEVEEYIDLELKSAKANWKYFDNNDYIVDLVRIERAAHNTIEGEKETTKKKKTAEEIKQLLLKKKQLFDGRNNYRVVEGTDTFNGYIAYIFDNGKVILERFFKKNRKGEEIIALDEAIYVMNIEEFDKLTRLSKMTLIKEKLCTRYYHRGDWVNKVIAEIESDGIIPAKDYQKLLKTKKVKE